MTLTPKEKELAAIGISVAAGCRPCTDHHVTVARKTRAGDNEFRQAIDDGLAVRSTAAQIMAAHALSHLGEEANSGVAFAGLQMNRQAALTCIGAAFAVNCTSSLEHYLAVGESAGLGKQEITQIVELSAFIKQKAASHVERLVGLESKEAV
jgi:AhpD family alkylhydroperoxidase